jgi:hypothetical protein
MDCNNKVSMLINICDSIEVLCGGYDYRGRITQCSSCREANEKAYPQGWREFPGDTCRHGNYIGGPSGPDYICGACEDAD